MLRRRYSGPPLRLGRMGQPIPRERTDSKIEAANYRRFVILRREHFRSARGVLTLTTEATTQWFADLLQAPGDLN